MMSSTHNLVLQRWLPVLVPDAQRAPTGRVARVMTFFLSHARGRSSAKHWMEYVSELEPEALDRIRIGLALAPMGQEDEFSVRELSLLRRRVRAAIATARRRWALPIREIEEDVFFVDLACDADEPDSSASSEFYVSSNDMARARWGTKARVVRGSSGEAGQHPIRGRVP